MNKQKEVEHVIKKHMKFRVTQDEFYLQGDKVYELAQDIVKLFPIPDVSKSACIRGFEAKSHYCFECEKENECKIP